jgi:predicted permease
LIVAQVSVSLLLLSGAGLLTRSLWNLRHQDFGFRPARLLLVDLPWEFSPTMMARYAALRGPLFERMNAVPGVQSAAISGFGPLGAAQHTGPIATAGQSSSAARIVHVSPRYFETTGISIVAGRGIGPEDRQDAPKVVVLSETAARVLFGAANPVGQLVSQEKSFDAKRAIEVVGVARDVRFAHPADPFGAVIYVSMAQFPAPITAVAVRATGDPALLVRDVRSALHEIDPDLAIGAVRAASDAIDALLGRERMIAWLAGCFGGLALVLTCVGVYGVISYAVERRTREVGVRLALGARGGQVTAMLIRELAVAFFASVVLGGAGAIVAGRLLRTLLFGIPPNDYSMVTWAVVVMIAVAASAAYIPARRAGWLDPTVALRQE